MTDVETLKQAAAILRRHGFTELASRVSVATNAVSQLARAIAETSGDVMSGPAGNTVSPVGTAGDRLRELRKAAGLSAEALASRIGRSASSIRAHENGQNGIGPEAATLYAGAFGVSATAILFGEG